MAEESLFWIGNDPLRHCPRLTRVVDKINCDIDNGESLLQLVMEHQIAMQMKVRDRSYQSLQVFVQSHIDKEIVPSMCRWWEDDLAIEYGDDMFDVLYPYCQSIASYVNVTMIPHIVRYVEVGANRLHVYYMSPRNASFRDIHLKFEWSSA